jgi:hypothetical protein
MRRRFIYPSDGSEPFEASDTFVPNPRVHVQGEIQPYRSMVTGEIIASRSQHRSHLKQHGKVEIGNELPKAPPPPKRDDSRIRELHQVFAGYGH